MVSEETLAQMKEYYRQRAAEYDQWWFRQGRFDHGPEANAAWFAELNQLFGALDGCGLTGDVLELAAGTGIWTERLVRTARHVTAVDAAPETLAINRAKVESERVTYVQADLFAWRPEREYDGVSCTFWLSHVPLERLDDFLGRVADALKPGGKFFFADSRREPSSTASNHTLPSADSQVMTRRLNDGSEYEVVKIYHDPASLAARFRAAGIDVDVRETAKYFIYGCGSKA